MSMSGQESAYRTIDLAGKADRGLVRATNEDSFLVLAPAALSDDVSAIAAVFDGVGGQVHGAEASSAAAQHLADLASGLSVEIATSEMLHRQLEQLICQLHEELRQDTVNDPNLRGMATTATIAL